jgi:calcineurin-like phosphoesterase family protein
MTNIWFTSDTHFGHANIIEYSHRPFKSVSHMNEALIENWNAVVGEDDTIFHLGDVAMGPWEKWDEILTRLNGYKVLVVGNHDRIFKGMSTRQNERFASHYDKWFDEVHHNIEGFELFNGEFVGLSHFPYEADHMEKARHMEFRLEDRGVPLIHGHTHSEKDVISRSAKGTVQIHVGVDSSNYTPVSEQQVVDYLRIADDLA